MNVWILNIFFSMILFTPYVNLVSPLLLEEATFHCMSPLNHLKALKKFKFSYHECWDLIWSRNFLPNLLRLVCVISERFLFFALTLLTGLKWVRVCQKKGDVTYLLRTNQDAGMFESESEDCCIVLVTCQSNLVKPHPHSPDKAK